MQQLQSLLNVEQQRRDEFYDWMTEDIKAEFINGEVIMQSPAKDRHTTASINLTTLLSTFVQLHDLGIVRAETALVALTRNDYLPDVCFFGRSKAAQIKPEQMKYPAPDFIAEILSPSTESIDRTIKFEDYAAHGVAEYWLIDPANKTVEQYDLQEGGYALRLKVQTGLLGSLVVEQFEIPVAAIFDAEVKNQTLQSMFAGKQTTS
jgi:Uma2 family endonuclease